jgi:hypothetical protein
MRLTVTTEDICNGKPGWNSKCALALAFKRAGFKQVRVGNRAATSCRRKSLRLFYLSKRAARFVVAFDTGKPVKSATFVLTEDTVGSEARLN